MVHIVIAATENECLGPQAAPFYASPVFVQSWALGPNLHRKVKNENFVVVFDRRVLSAQDHQDL